MPETQYSEQPDPLQAQLNGLKTYVQQSVQQGAAIHEVEQGLWTRLLALGHRTLEVYLSLQGDGDVGETLALESGETVRRLPGLQGRDYQSVFGHFHLDRAVYGTRVGQKIVCVPLDSRLQLPEGKFSYLLQDWDQSLAVESPYAQVTSTLERILGFRQSSDSLERMNRQMSASVNAFERSRPAPPTAGADQLIVASADGKGVPIRQAADSPTIAGHRTKRGPKPNRKRMATVGAVYTVGPRIRTPERVLDALFRRPGEPSTAACPPSRPQAKRLTAQLNVTAASESAAESAAERPRATAQVFSWLAGEVHQRQPTDPVPLVVLMDGQPSLWETAKTAFTQSPRVEILDLLHVTSRIWQVVAFSKLDNFEAAVKLVKGYVSLILNGKVKDLITVWRLLADAGTFKPKQNKKLNKICQYLENNLHRMRYDQYLAAGFPIASGVIEGACRHFVKDRMERAGMQWTLVGAQAMLDLRSVALNDDWADFNHFRIEGETQRLYPHRNLLGTVDWPLSA